eukprot:s12765_g1.t1
MERTPKRARTSVADDATETVLLEIMDESQESAIEAIVSPDWSAMSSPEAGTGRLVVVSPPKPGAYPDWSCMISSPVEAGDNGDKHDMPDTVATLGLILLLCQFSPALLSMTSTPWKLATSLRWKLATSLRLRTHCNRFLNLLFLLPEAQSPVATAFG